MQAAQTGADLVVIGAGVLGASIAVSATRRGLRVVVVDRNAAAGFGSTSASAGIVRIHAGDVESSLLATESVLGWKAWRDFAEVPRREAAAQFVQCGTYILDDSNGSIERARHILLESGAEFSELDGEALAEALPWADTRRLGPPSLPEAEGFWRSGSYRIEQAIHTPASGYVADPALAAQNLADLARRRGAEIVLGRNVVDVRDARAQELLVVLDDGRSIPAKNVVNVAGPASARVNAMLSVGRDFRVGQRLVRHELHHVTMPDPGVPTAHIVDGDLGINFRPEGADGFLVGSSGAPVDGEEQADSPDGFVARATRESWYRQAGRALRRIPGVVLPPKPRGVAGLYDVTDDWLPIYDRTDRPGVFVAIGTSGNQFKNAPVVGEIMMEFVVASLNGEDTDRSSVSIDLPGLRRRIDASVFSRLRTPGAGGSRG